MSWFSWFCAKLVAHCEAAPMAHWEGTPMYGGSEHRRLVRDDDGRVLVNIIHGQGPGATWCVCKGPYGRDFTTEDQAKKCAEGLVRVTVRDGDS